MSNFFELKNIFINQNISNKQEAFEKVMEIFLENNVIEKEYLDSMKIRDRDSSVALGNFLALPHGTDGSDHLIKKNCVVLIHLQKAFYWDEQPIHFIFALALKGSEQMEFVQKAGVAFGDIDEVEAILSKKDLQAQDLYNWINNS